MPEVLEDRPVAGRGTSMCFVRDHERPQFGSVPLEAARLSEGLHGGYDVRGRQIGALVSTFHPAGAVRTLAPENTPGLGQQLLTMRKVNHACIAGDLGKSSGHNRLA